MRNNPYITIIIVIILVNYIECYLYIINMIMYLLRNMVFTFSVNSFNMKFFIFCRKSNFIEIRKIFRLNIYIKIMSMDKFLL